MTDDDERKYEKSGNETLDEQRARLRFLRDEGLEFLAAYRALATADDREAVQDMLRRMRKQE